MSPPAGTSNSRVIREVAVDAHEKWNRSGLVLRKGVAYSFLVPREARWHDWFVPCGAEGHDHWTTRPFKFLLRVRSVAGRPVPFFMLVGTLGGRIETAFPIGLGCTRTFVEDGELVCFANDVPWAYGNNHGVLPLTVEWSEPAG